MFVMQRMTIRLVAMCGDELNVGIRILLVNTKDIRLFFEKL